MQTVQLYINNQRVDLFDDESISLNSSIQNVKDISKIFTDYSQTFTIPTSKNNNKIFQHYDNSDIVDGYDARIRTTARIELNNIPFKDGTIRLNKVIRRKGISYAYDITFFGSTATLSRILGDDKLKDLSQELSAYNHEWTYDNILQGLQTGLEVNSDTSAIIYPLISPLRRFIFDSDVNYSPIDGIANIGSLLPGNGFRPQDVKPAIRLIRVLEAIEAKYPQLQFSRDFFGGSMFNELYLWLHRNAGQISSASGKSERIISNFSLVSEDLGCGDNYARFFPDYFSIVTGGNLSNGVDAQAAITITPNDLNVEYSYKVIDLLTDTILYETTTTGASSRTINIGAFYEPIQEWNIQVQISTDDSSTLTSYDAEWYIQTYYMVNGERDCQDIQEYSVSSQNMLTDIIVGNQMPDIKIIDLLTGIFKMFNLTSFVEDEIIVVKDLNSFYDSYNEYDITEYVDTDEITVSRLPLYSNIDFDYKDPVTFLAKEFSESNGQNFGEEKYNVIIQDEYIDGEEYSIKLPFEKVVYERLNDQVDDVLTNAQYGWFVSENEDKLLGSPLIFFNVNTDPGSKNIYFRSTDGITNSSLDTYNRPSNSSSDNSQTLNFGEENDEYELIYNSNSLFKNFYESYIESVFNKYNRLTNLTAWLPLNILTKYKLNDRFIIGDHKYTINTIQTNLQSGKSEIELLNVLNDVFAPVLTCPTADNDIVTIDSTLYTVDCGDRLCATADETTVTVDDTDLTVDCGDPIPTTTTTTSTTTTSTTSTTTTAGTTTTTTAGTTTTAATTTAGTTTTLPTTTTTETPCIQRISYSPIPTQSIEVAENKTINLDNFFTQLDGQPLYYLAINNTVYLDSVSVSGNQLTMFANSGNLCGSDGVGVYVQAYDSISGNCVYGTFFTIEVFGCTVETTTTTEPTTTTTSTSTTTSTTTAGTTTTQATTTTQPTTTTLPTTTTTTEAPQIIPQGSIVNTFVGYDSTGANFNVYTINAIQTYLDFSIYPTGGGSYSERQPVPTVNGQTLNWTISWDGDISTTDGGTGVCNLTLLDNIGIEHTVATSSFIIPAISVPSQVMTTGGWAQVGISFTRFGYSRGENVKGSLTDTRWQPQTNWTIWVIENDVVDNFVQITLRRGGLHEEPAPFTSINFDATPFTGSPIITQLNYADIDVKTVGFESDGYTYTRYKWNYNTDTWGEDAQVTITFN